MITKSETIQTANNLVLTLAQVKAHLRVDGDNENDLITLYMQSAQLAAENVISRAVGIQQYVLYLDSFDSVFIDASSLDALDDVDYYPSGSASLVALPSGQKEMTQCGIDTLKIKFSGTLPEVEMRSDAIRVKVKRGYTLTDCPAPIKNAMLLMIGDAYERREDRGEVGHNTAANALLRPYRRW